MDGEKFDAMLRDAVSVASRRKILKTGISALAMSALGIFGRGGAHDARAKNQKRKNKRKHKGVRCRHLRGHSGGWFACGDGCCLKGHRVCCADLSDPSGKSCFPHGSVCCPAEFGGGACDEGHHCCPPSCSNEANNRCCPEGQKCCNDAAECTDPGARCELGCCIAQQ
jgi:hypothetical protein